MGIVSTTLSQSNNMKFLLVLAVAAYARAEAEAKPGFVYTVGHHAPLVVLRPLWLCFSPVRLWVLRTSSGLCWICWILPLRLPRRLQKWLRSPCSLCRQIVLMSQLLF